MVVDKEIGPPTLYCDRLYLTKSLKMAKILKTVLQWVNCHKKVLYITNKKHSSQYIFARKSKHKSEFTIKKSTTKVSLLQLKI